MYDVKSESQPDTIALLGTNYSLQIIETGFAEQFYASHRMGPAPICLKISARTAERETYRMIPLKTHLFSHWSIPWIQYSLPPQGPIQSHCCRWWLSSIGRLCWPTPMRQASRLPIWSIQFLFKRLRFYPHSRVGVVIIIVDFNWRKRVTGILVAQALLN